MKTKVEMTIEVLMPTQVTKIIEFPIFYSEIANYSNSWLSISVNDINSKYVPYRIIEVVKYNRDKGEYRMYIKDVSDNEIASLIAKSETGSYNEISYEEFREEYMNALNNYVDIINFI